MHIFPKPNRLALWAATISLAGMLGQGCSNSAHSGSLPEVRVTKPARGELVSSFVAPGRVQAKAVRLSADEHGRLLSLKVNLNDVVHRGQLLAQLDDSDQRARLRSLEADLDATLHRRAEAGQSLDSKRTELQSDLERARAGRSEAYDHYREVAAGAGREALDEARAGVNEAAARYRQAEHDLARQKKLFSQDIVSIAQLEKAQGAFDESAAKQAEARAGLLKLEHSPCPEAVSVAHSQVVKADVEIDAAQASTRELPVLQERLEAADADIQKTRADLDEARLALARTQIFAPCDGVVSNVSIEPGEVAAIDKPILVIQRVDHLWVDAELDEQDSGQVQVGQSVDITLSTQPGKTYPGKVSEIAPALEQRASAPGDSKILHVKINFDGKVPGVRPGLHVDVQGRAAVARDALHIPTSAIQSAGNQSFVMSVSGGTLHKVPVTVGQRSADQTVVRQGLSADTDVVVEGAEGLSDGASVQVHQ